MSCVSELYWSQLKDFETERVRKCSINVSNDWDDKEFSYGDWNELKSINLTLNIDEYFRADKFNKKKIQLELIYKGMIMIAEREGWAIDPLLDAYNNCFAVGLEYKFFVGEKFKASPDRKYKIGLWCEWDIDSFRLFWVLFDKQGKR